LERNALASYEGRKEPITAGLGINPAALLSSEWNDINDGSTGFSEQSDCSLIFPFTPPTLLKLSFEQLTLPETFWEQCPLEAETSSLGLTPNRRSPTHDQPEAPRPPPSKPPPPLAPKENAAGNPQSTRRGPGRPKKHEVKTQVFKAMKKQSHNLSASQSRARLNSVIDELWHLLPQGHRLRRAHRGGKKRKVTRTEKIEETIQYIRVLQEELSAPEGP